MRPALFAAAALCAVLPAHAWAQPSSSSDEPVTTVDAFTDVEALVVTASRSGEAVSVAATPASITVLPPRALQERQVRDVSDVLRDAPGVAVSRVPGSTQVRLRGAEANHTLVLIDGIEASDPYAGEFDFGLLSADESARVEVLRGQQSALYGSDAIGGVIHYITSTGAEAPGLRGRVEAGSFGAVNSALRYGRAAGGLDTALSLTARRSEGTPNARGGERELGSDSVSLSGKTTWAPTDVLRVQAVARLHRSDADFNNTEFDPASPNFGLVIDSPGSHVETDAAYARLRGELDVLDGRWRHALEAQVADTERRGFDFDQPSYGSDGRRTKLSYETTFAVNGSRAEQRFTGAVDAERETFRNADPSGFAFSGEREVETVGVVGQYELTLDERLSATASLRHDAADLFEDATTYRLGASYRFDNGLRLRAAAGSGIKNPGFFELFGFINGRYIGNPDLKPERSEGFELGVERTFAGRITAGAVYFDNRLQDEIFTIFPAPAFVAVPANRTTESEQKGVETFLNARLGGGWSADFAYTSLRARENGEREVRRADAIASLAVTWRDPGERGGLTVVARYNGEQDDLAFTDPSFTPVRVRLDEFLLVSLNGDFVLTPRVSLFGRVENLLDEDYEEVFSFVAPGRAAYAGLRARF